MPCINAWATPGNACWSTICQIGMISARTSARYIPSMGARLATVSNMSMSPGNERTMRMMEAAVESWLDSDAVQWKSMSLGHRGARRLAVSILVILPQCYSSISRSSSSTLSSAREFGPASSWPVEDTDTEDTRELEGATAAFFSPTALKEGDAAIPIVAKRSTTEGGGAEPLLLGGALLCGAAAIDTVDAHFFESWCSLLCQELVVQYNQLPAQLNTKINIIKERDTRQYQKRIVVVPQQGLHILQGPKLEHVRKHGFVVFKVDKSINQ